MTSGRIVGSGSYYKKGELGTEQERRKRGIRLANGGKRDSQHASLKCIVDPGDGVFFGSFFFEGQFNASLKEGVFPSGSLWYNDHEEKVYEVLGEAGVEQEVFAVGKKRLKMMESRYPRLRYLIPSQ